MDVLKNIYRNKFSDIPDKDNRAYTFLLNKGIKASDIKSDISKALGTEYLDLSSVPLNGELLREFSKDELKKRRVFPIYKDGDVIHFVVNSLLDRNLKNVVEEFSMKLGGKSFTTKYFLLNFEFDEMLESLHLGIDIEQYREENRDIKEPVVEISTESLGAFDAERIAELILNKGFENKASDIHIEPLPRGFQARYRVDGLLSIVDPFDSSELEAQSLVNYFKIKSGMKIEERRKGQDGRLRDRKYRGKFYDLRISTITSTIGEKIAIRLLEKDSTIPGMKDLGFSKFYANAIKKDMEKHHGLILNTGSVGSGKSTTQRTLLVGLDAKKLNIYSIEDPVERTIPYVNHVCVKETSVSFEYHLETLLRQDPDVVAIGEIRNLATMDMALKAALSGQLVFATMHTNSAIEAFYRLFNMGVESYELGAALLGIGSQRLVRTLCPYCKSKRDIEENEKTLISGMMSRYEKFSDFNLSKFKYLYDACGCNHCNHTGYNGRTVIAEYLTATNDVKTYVSTGEVVREKLLELADNSFVPIEVDALNKVLLGKTTLSEIIKSV